MKTKRVSRRDFVRATVAVPTLALVGETRGETQPVAAGPATPLADTHDARFTPLDLSPHFNASAASIPAGRHAFWGIPFQLRAEKEEHGLVRLGPAPVRLTFE